MKALSGLGIGLSLVSGFLLLALIAEVYYLFLWKKRVANREMDDENYQSPAKELLYILCWKKPSFFRSAALNPQQVRSSVHIPNGSEAAHLDSSSSKNYLLPFGGGEESVEAELMRLHSLSGPPRFLCTIKEETKEDLESESGRSRKGSRGTSLGDLLLPLETPFLTPLSSPPFFTPPLTPMDCCIHHGFNPLFESSKIGDLSSKIRSSPPPKFKFLKDAEEKLCRKTLMEEALKAQKNNGELVDNLAKKNSSVATAGMNAFPPLNEEDGSFITIVIGKNRENGSQHNHHLNSSQVNPLSSPPSVIRGAHRKLG